MSSVCDSYLLVCHPKVTCMYSYVIRMSIVCHSYVLVCHPCVTCMWFYHEPKWSPSSPTSIVITIFRFPREKKTPGLIQIAFNKRQYWIHKRLISFKGVCVINIQPILLSLFIKLKRVPSFQQQLKRVPSFPSFKFFSVAKT